MNEKQKFSELVRQAQGGREESKNRLAREVESRLRAHIYRVTLDYDLAEDLSQEGLLEMAKSLGDLRNRHRFWPWLYEIAHSKIQQHYREKRRRAAISASAFYDDFLSHRAARVTDNGLRQLLREEMSKTVITAMRDMKQQHRAVLSLRCFDELSYADVALAMQCSETGARVLFFRAKHALKRQLTRRGVSKSLLLMCLGLFGKLTAPAEAVPAAVSVSAASAKVGLSTAVLAATTSKVGVATIAAAVISLGTISSVTVFSEPALPQRPGVNSFHYTVQSRDNNPGAASSLSKGAYEQWYYFPEGVDGPVYMRMQRWNPRQTRKLCGWLQNDQANYYHYAGKEPKVFVNNYRLWLSSLRVRRLPTDSAEFTSFLSKVEGELKGVDYTRDPKSGLLAGAVDRRFIDAMYFRTSYEYNSLDESQFQYEWGDEVPIVDERDQMRKRGWTYFRINGKVAGKTVTGRGRIPFVYEAYKEYAPQLVLQVGSDVRIIDCSDGAYVYGPGGKVSATYASGAFFEGLGRPWMGMHTVDIVRRDAAGRRMWFETSADEEYKEATVVLFDERDSGDTDVVYTIDMENDIIKDVKFRVNSRSVGSLTFSYLQDISGVGGEFVEVAVGDESQSLAQEEPAVLWLIDLAQGKLGK